LKLELSTPASTAAFVVTLAEPVVQAETVRLSAALERAGVSITAQILNRADDGALADERAWLRAPELTQEITGTAALQSFLGQWELNGE
jgi:hypothetical protein